MAAADAHRTGHPKAAESIVELTRAVRYCDWCCWPPLEARADTGADALSADTRLEGHRKSTLDHLLTDPGVRPANPKERRDMRRVLEHWLRHASSNDGVPVLDNFDFASIKRHWGHRFLICTDQNAEDAAFLAYGATFAAQLELPETVAAI
jgi:hypothetical protein